MPPGYSLGERKLSGGDLGCQRAFRGVRRDTVTEPCSYYRMEIDYSQFERSVAR